MSYSYRSCTLRAAIPTLAGIQPSVVLLNFVLFPVEVSLLETSAEEDETIKKETLELLGNGQYILKDGGLSLQSL